MSDLQDLIHKTSIDCIEKGQRMERERIIKLLEEEVKHLRQISQSIQLDPYMSREDWEDPDTGADYIGYFIKKLLREETK